MRNGIPRSITLRIGLRLLLVGLVWSEYGASQTEAQSASQLIKFLAYQSGRPDYGSRLGIECTADLRAAEESRSAANALVRIGSNAIPDLEKGIDSLVQSGGQSPYFLGGAWMLLVYANILGPGALPRLQGVIGSPKLGGGFERVVDASIATSLGLTSYVDRAGWGYGIGFSCEPREPRDALDRLILAWEKNDQQGVEASLGPSAKGSLDSLLRHGTWALFRRGAWRASGRKSTVVAVGYRFDATGSWSQPGMTLDESVGRSRANVDVSPSQFPLNPQIETSFTDKGGKPCGRYQILFVATHAAPLFRAMYLVDTVRIEDLLKLISTCAAR